MRKQISMSTEQQNEDQSTNNELSPAARSALAAMDGFPSTDGGTGLKEGLEALSSSNAETPSEPVNEITQTKSPEDSKQVVGDLLNNEVSKPDEEVSGEEAAPQNAGEVNSETQNESNDPNVESDDSGEQNTEEKETFIESEVFGGKLKINNEKKEAPKAFETPQEVNDFIKSNMGFDNLESLVDDYKASQEKIKGYEDIGAKYDHVANLINNMPDELYQAVDAFNRGDDWREKLVSRPSLDFTKDVSNLSEKQLVDTYFPGEFTAEEWEDSKSEDADIGTKKAIQLAVSQSKQKFLNDQEELKGVRQAAVDRVKKDEEAQAEKVKAFEASVNRSVENMKSNINGVADSYIEKIKSELTLDNIAKAFLNEDGTLKEDAATRYTMALHGQGMIQQYQTVANHKAETQERQKILERTPEQPKAKNKTEQTTDNLSDAAKRKLAEIRGNGFDKKPTY